MPVPQTPQQARREDGYRSREADRPEPGSFVANLSPTARALLRDIGSRQVYPAGAPIFFQGDPTQHVLLLEKGWVKVTSTSRHGWEALLAIRGPGDILGELSAVDGRPRSATVSGLTRVEATVLTCERLHACLREQPEIALSLLRHLATSLREADNRRTEYGATNGDSRLAMLLVELVDRHGRPAKEGVVIDLPLSQRELASSVGVSREVVARTLRLLRERRILLTQRRRIIVLRIDLLRSLAGSVSMLTKAS